MGQKTILLVVAMFAFMPLARGADPANSVRLRVIALTVLNDLDATPEQMRALHRLARGAAANAPAEKIPDAYRGALEEMIKAFERNDETAIDAAQAKIDKVCGELKITEEPAIEPTDAARERAERALRQFTAGQIAAFVGEWADDISGPEDLLVDAMTEIRGKTGADFEAIRDRTAKQVAVLLGGVDAKLSKDTNDKALAWLNKVHGSTNAEFVANRAEFVAEARKIPAQPDPIPALRHWVTYSFAELLSNPELPAAIESRLKQTAAEIK